MLFPSYQEYHSPQQNRVCNVQCCVLKVKKKGFNFNIEHIINFMEHNFSIIKYIKLDLVLNPHTLLWLYNITITIHIELFCVLLAMDIGLCSKTVTYFAFYILDFKQIFVCFAHKKCSKFSHTHKCRKEHTRKKNIIRF